MGIFDLFERQMRRGNTGQKTVTTVHHDPVPATQWGHISPPGSPYLTHVDPALDLEWSGYSAMNDSPAPNSYFDYYFVGEDVRAYIEGIEDHPEFSMLPLFSIGWNIEQEKRPVYGMWSYTYDGVMRGTRIVQGEFSIFVKAPDYIKRAIALAAEARSKASGQYSSVRGETLDERNIEKYWRQNLDPSVLKAGQHIFSSHPPFNIVIVYGVQSVSLTEHCLPVANDLLNTYQRETTITSDVNERLVESDPIDQSNRVIIEDCEIVQVQSSIQNDMIVMEKYQFFARDCTYPVKQSTTPSVGGYKGGGRSRFKNPFG